MLVLTRKTEQKIQIGCGITLTILRVQGGTVRIGIEAPSDVKILRGELAPMSGSNRQGASAGTPPGEDTARVAPETGDSPENTDSASAPGSDDTEVTGEKVTGTFCAKHRLRQKAPATFPYPWRHAPRCEAAPPGIQNEKSGHARNLAVHSLH